jgi:hemerythrin superfamily protein
MEKAKTQRRRQDAIALLKADHEKVSQLFEQFDKARSADRKRELAAQICRELTVHTRIEEEMFYPAAKAALNDTEMVPEALVEHEGVKQLIDAIQRERQDGEMFEARVNVMAEMVKHHVKEEEQALFPAVRKTELDLVELGVQLQFAKDALMREESETA